MPEDDARSILQQIEERITLSGRLHEAQIEGREEEQRQQNGGDLRFVLEPPIGDFVQHSILHRMTMRLLEGNRQPVFAP